MHAVFNSINIVFFINSYIFFFFKKVSIWKKHEEKTQSYVMLNPLSTSLNPLSSDSELSGFKIRNTLTFYLGGTQWSPRYLYEIYKALLCNRNQKCILFKTSGQQKWRQGCWFTNAYFALAKLGKQKRVQRDIFCKFME